MRALLQDVLAPEAPAPRISVIVGAFAQARKVLAEWVSTPFGEEREPSLPAGLLAPQLTLATAAGSLLNDSLELAAPTTESAIYKFACEDTVFELEVVSGEEGQFICLTVPAAAFAQPPMVRIMDGEEVLMSKVMAAEGATLVVTFHKVPDGCHILIDVVPETT
jgi:hypothetical protein